MINPYFEIITKEEDNFKDFLERVRLLDIFKEIFDTFPEMDLCKKIVKFITYAYSLESDKISTSGDRRVEKKRIFDSIGLKGKEIEELVLNLEAPSVIICIEKWLAFQDNDNFNYLVTLKENYVQQQRGSLLPTTDYNQKQKCVEHMNSLRKMIKEATSELIQNSEKLKEAHVEVRKAAKKHNTTGIEAFAL